MNGIEVYQLELRIKPKKERFCERCKTPIPNLTKRARFCRPCSQERENERRKCLERKKRQKKIYKTK
jgi:hypothetical protein